MSYIDEVSEENEPQHTEEVAKWQHVCELIEPHVSADVSDLATARVVIRVKLDELEQQAKMRNLTLPPMGNKPAILSCDDAPERISF